MKPGGMKNGEWYICKCGVCSDGAYCLNLFGRKDNAAGLYQFKLGFDVRPDQNKAIKGTTKFCSMSSNPTIKHISKEKAESILLAYKI